METRTRRALVAGAIVALALAAYAGYVYFAPKPSTRVDQPFDAAAFAPVKSGAFRDGLPAHHVSGIVSIVRAADGSHLARFEDYEATPGPDVYFYLTPKAGAGSAAEVEGAGVRLPVPGGAGDGQATLRGSFQVPLPAGVDPAAYEGVSVWCQRYDALFGSAALA